MVLFISVFFFNDTATTEIYTLSLHDALPISPDGPARLGVATGEHGRPGPVAACSDIVLVERVVADGLDGHHIGGRGTEEYRGVEEYQDDRDKVDGCRSPTDSTSATHCLPLHKAQKPLKRAALPALARIANATSIIIDDSCQTCGASSVPIGLLSTRTASPAAENH